MLFRMAQQAFEANQERVPAGVLEVLPCKLELVGVDGEQPPPVQAHAHVAGKQPGVMGPSALLPRRADVLITDLLDHSVLGMGLLPAVDHAARVLLAPGAQVIPQNVLVGRRSGALSCRLAIQRVHRPCPACRHRYLRC